MLGRSNWSNEMTTTALDSLSMMKYQRLLPRIFPAASRFEIRDRKNRLYWHHVIATCESIVQENEDVYSDTDWIDEVPGLGKRQIDDSVVQFRSAILNRGHAPAGWLIAEFDTTNSIPMEIAGTALSRAFADAGIVLQGEIELQSECNQLAAELTERYEELNLVYATKDHVEYFEEGHEALIRLVQNCADYLDVGLAVLICRDRDLILHHVDTGDPPPNIEDILELISGDVYDRVESRARCLIINESDDDERDRVFLGRTENLIANPVLDELGTVIGILVVVARKTAHTFSNGDRNLLEVMTRKASRIIYTHHDSLTGLMNRSGFESTLVSTLAAARTNNQQHCVLHLDLDQLHVVNDLLGYQEGDNLIRRAAKVLRSILRDSDFVARLGGDEFGALLCNCSANQGQNIARKIRKAIGELTVTSARRRLDVSASIGIAMLNNKTDGIVSVLASSEIACKAAKEAGRNRVQVFEEDNTVLVRRSEEVEWSGRVQEALRENGFLLYCQPVVPLNQSQHSQHFEMLVRMKGEDEDVLLPGVFMPAAERYQLMPMLDRWVIHHSLQSISMVWPEISSVDPVFCINLSGQSLTNPGFQSFVVDELRQAGVAFRNICFEITETAAIGNIDEAIVFMNAIKKLGCKFALDDFGAGLSSFGYLKVLPVDYLKIDGSFVRDMVSDDVSRSMVQAIYQIGRTMGLLTIAEFVEDEQTRELLRQIGVDYIQGFGVGKPAPLAGILDELQGISSAALA